MRLQHLLQNDLRQLTGARGVLAMRTIGTVAARELLSFCDPTAPKLTITVAPLHCVMLKILSIIGYFGMAGGLVGLLATQNLFSSSPLVISLQVVAILLFLWARLTFGRRSFHVVADPTEGGLVTGGPYRYIRHPIYAAICLFTLAGVAGHWSWSSGLLVGWCWPAP